MTYLSFIFALIFFSVELLVYRTVTVRTVMPMMLVTAISLIYMPYYWTLNNQASMFNLTSPSIYHHTL